NLDRALEDGTEVFTRWQTLPAPVRTALEHQASAGFRHACVLTARALLAAGRQDEATRAFARGLRQRAPFSTYPAALDYLIRRTVGPAWSRRFDKWTQLLIAHYRQRRFDYRYHS